MQKDRFIVQLCSDLDYEEMVADIIYGDHTVALVTQEKGPAKMEIEIFASREPSKTWKFALNDFVEAIQFAKECLSTSSKEKSEKD